MEIVSTLRKREFLEKIVPLVDGVIVGHHFSNGFHFTLDELKEINDYCKLRKCKIYFVIDNFISEDDYLLLNEYLNFIESLDVDGIYFHDLGLYDISKQYNLTHKLIYDGKNVLCNALDISFFLKRDVDSVMISRELTLEEIQSILTYYPNKIDIQIFGHIRLSYSKRKFLSNYFKEINKEYDYLESESLSIVEDQRNYKMPILENKEGTTVYSDYVLEMFNEICDLKANIKRGIIDTLFIDDINLIQEICRDYRRITNENKEFIIEGIKHSYPINYGKGFLYQKTNITKDE